MFENFSFTSYYVDKVIWKTLEVELKDYNNILIITGNKSFEAVKENILPILENKNIIIENYLGECCYEHSSTIIKNIIGKQVDLILGIGGGKAIDTAKLVANQINKTIFIIPTIASTCAGTSALSVVYNQDKTFKEIAFFKAPPEKIFIDLETIKNSPSRYTWAGIGDTLAKYYEVKIKHEYCLANNKKINFPTQMAIELSHNCKNIIIKNSEEGYYSHEINEAFKNVVLTIIVTTGMVSNFIDDFLNGAIAHSVFYGLTILPRIEKEHLHGEVVAYGILVQLLLENNLEEYKRLTEFYKKLKFPINLTDVIILEEFLEKENDILEEILRGPDLIDFNFNINKNNLKEALFYKNN